MEKVIEFKSETENLPDYGTLTIRAFSGTFVDDNDSLFGFIAYDIDQTVSVGIGLREIPKKPIDLIRECFYMGDKTFESMIKTAIDNERHIQCNDSTLDYHEYVNCFTNFSKAEIIPLAPVF